MQKSKLLEHSLEGLQTLSFFSLGLLRFMLNYFPLDFTGEPKIAEIYKRNRQL